ncbi:MAG: conjugative transposon protein TraJ [Puia sp.]|nr:conjugative transposon protein TraJ [Puia sp.]
MKKSFACASLLAGIVLLLPFCAFCQDTTSSFTSDITTVQKSLFTVFKTMLASCGELTGVARGIAAFGALLYCSNKIWGHLGRAEPIDFMPLLRPFAIGVVLVFYTTLIDVMNDILEPTNTATNALVKNSNQAIANLLAQKQQLLEQGQEWQAYVGPDGNGSMEKWAEYTGNTDNGVFSGLGNWVKFEMSKAEYNIKNSFKLVLSQILETLFEAASLCVNTVRIFYLVVLAIVGPLVLGLSVFDGLHHLVVAWFAKYVHIFLWLPVCNIFGSIIGQVEVQMLKIDIQQLQASGQTTFGATDLAYLVFLCMGLVGYCSVPSITQHIITVFPAGGAHLQKVTNAASQSAGTVASTSIKSAAMAATVL